LTCDFWAENDGRKIEGRTNAIESGVSTRPLRLIRGLILILTLSLSKERTLYLLVLLRSVGAQGFIEKGGHTQG
jgi:hypothetical protein